MRRETLVINVSIERLVMPWSRNDQVLKCFHLNHKRDTHPKTWGVEGVNVPRLTLGVQC